MKVILTIVRYPKWLGWAGFFSMVFFRIPLWFNNKISFYKLLGCGKNGTFSKIPDLRQWAILAVFQKKEFETPETIFGKFICNWWKFFGAELWTVLLEPTEGHGTWDGKKPFGNLPKSTNQEGITAVLTRASIRPSKLHRFWAHVDGVSQKMISAPGFITSVGIGEAPWIKQATFSIWESKESMKAFAYKMHEHADVVRKTRHEKWYSEDLFVRFKVIASHGTQQGKNPLEGKL